MRRITSVLVLGLALPLFAAAQQSNSTSATPPSHGTPQTGQHANSASKTTKAAHNKKSAKTAQADLHGTPQGETPQK